MSPPDIPSKRKHKPLSLSTKKQKSKNLPSSNPQNNASNPAPKETVNNNPLEPLLPPTLQKPRDAFIQESVLLPQNEPKKETRKDRDDWNRVPAEVEEHMTNALNVGAILRTLFSSCPASRPFSGKTFFPHEECSNRSRGFLQRDEGEAHGGKNPQSSKVVGTCSSSTERVNKTKSKDPPLHSNPNGLMAMPLVSDQQRPKMALRGFYTQDASRPTTFGQRGSERNEISQYQSTTSILHRHPLKLGKEPDRAVGLSGNLQNIPQWEDIRRNDDSNHTETCHGPQYESIPPRIPQKNLPSPSHWSPCPPVPFKAPTPPSIPSSSTNAAQASEKLATCPLCGTTFSTEMTNFQINGHVDECLNRAYLEDGGSVDV